MRLIDAEQFEVISWSAQGQRGDYARGYDDGVQYVAAKIDHTPTVDAIPVEWIKKNMTAAMAYFAPRAKELLLEAWQEEQEG